MIVMEPLETIKDVGHHIKSNFLKSVIVTEFERISIHKTQCTLQGELEGKDKHVKDGKFKLQFFELKLYKTCRL